MVSFMESGYTQNTASMGHTGTLTVRPSPYKEEMSQSELALFQLRDFFARRPQATLLSVYREFDDSGEGKLDKGEFSDAMKQLNLDVAEHDMDDLFNQFQPDAEGNIHVASFMNTIRAQPDGVHARFDRVGIGRHYLKPNSEPPDWDAPIVPTNGDSGFSRDGAVCTRPDTTMNPPKNASPFKCTPKAEKVLGTLREYFSIRPAKDALDVFQMFDTHKGRLRCDALTRAHPHAHAPTGASDYAPLARRIRFLTQRIFVELVSVLSH